MATKYTDPLYDSLDADVTAKLGLPDGLLTAIRVHGEKTNADQVSSAGAKTVYQVIPKTRDAVVKKYGVDPYESPQAAAMAAGYLLRESLQRNNGDVTAAVREYHGGTNRKNWGSTNSAYVNRVMAGMGRADAGANPYTGIKLPSLGDAAAGGSGGGGGEPARLTIAQKLAKYNAGKMSGDELTQFESALVAGDIVLPDGKTPKQIVAKQLQAVAEEKRIDAAAKKAKADQLNAAAQPTDYTGNRMQQFTDQAGEALSNAGRAIVGDGGFVDTVTGIPRAILGGTQALITGGVGMGVDSVAGLTGLLAGAAGMAQGEDFSKAAETASNQIDYTRQALQPIIPQPVIAPNTANAMLGVLSVPALGTQAAGQANYDEHGQAWSAALLQGLSDAGLAALGFRGIGKPAAARPQPTPVPRTETPIDAPTPRPQPAPVEPLPTNPADLAARAENMPRPDNQSARSQPVDVVAQAIEQGKPAVLRDPDAIRIAEASPDYHLRQNEDGTATVIGKRKEDGTWSGAPKPSTEAAPRPTNPNTVELTPESPTITMSPDGSSSRPARERTVKEAPPTATSHTPIANREKGHKAKVVDEDGRVTYELSRDNVTYHHVIEDGRAVGVKITHDGKSGDARVQTTDLRTGEVEQNTSYPAAEGFSPVQILSQNTAGSLFDLLHDGHYKRNPAELTAAERGALADNIEAAHKANRARLDASREQMRAELMADDPAPPQARTPQGKAFTTDNTPVDFVYDVVPVESIQKSLNADMTQNKAARPDLQPRNRDTDASTAQVNEISNNLNPNRLLESPTFDTGAPAIIGAEAVAGHGRLTAIERRYMSGRGADYKAAVVAKAQELGIDPAKFAGIDNPVLVRRLPDDATAVKVASDSNASTTLQMSVAEQARTDAKSLPDASKLVIGEDGTVNIAGSTDFVREFMRSMPTAARGDLMRPDGTLSQAGVRRIQSAIAQKAYNDATMLERVNESLDDQGKRISAALVRNAGALVALADEVKAGARVENTLAPDLAMAANKYADIKASGSSVGEYMAQGRLVDDGMTAGALEALQVFGDNARSGKAVSEYIQGKIKEIEDQGNPSQETLFQTAKEQKEADAVRRQYEGTPQWMQAPDGTPTKLSERQWVQVRTPSFKEWFGDWEGNPKGASKVVDENGEPLVVYHGTSGGRFDSFEPYSFFTDSKKIATRYSEQIQPDGSLDGNVFEVFLSLKNIREMEMFTIQADRLKHFNRSKKIDATVNPLGNGGFVEYVIRNPAQIKSATGNSGAFDGANPNIYMQGNKPASQVIADAIAKQVAETGKFDADYAAAAGELAAAYYKATAAAIGKTSKEVFDAVPLDVKAGEVRDGAKAQISFGEKQHSMVLGPTADASGFIHELGHHFLETHAKLAEDSPVLKADLDAIMEWGGHKGRKFDDLKAAQKTELHEKFAETFEQYLLTGKAPTAKLKAVFDRFKTWMESVYDSLVTFGETNPRAKLSDDIVGVLDNMLGNKADARANAAKEAKRTKKTDAELLDFKRSAPADGGVSPAQHQSRYNVLRAIGLTEGQIRGGVVTGDARRMGWDSLLAKADTEAGRKMKQQMELESDKLREYGDAIVEATGGTLHAAPEVRGLAILKPLEEYRDVYKAQIQEYYAAADQKAKATGGIELTDFQTKLRENSFFSRDGMSSLRKGIASWMREQDLVGADGHFRPMSGKQAESLRQYINSQYDYSIAGGIRVLNDLIDDAVFKTLGENMYADARALNAKYHRIFTDPKGISVLLDSDGINRRVSPEKVGTKLAALAEVDVAQFQHIIDQLEVLAPIKGEKPTALQADAMRAIGEIRAQIAEKITTFDPTKPDSLAGTARAYAPFRGEKLDAIFGKDAAAKLRNYVAARGVLRHVDPNPTGSASVWHNLAMRGTETMAGGIGAGAGALVAGGAGALVLGVISQQIGKRLQARIIEAADQKSYDKAMSPTQLQNMRQSMGARGRRLGESQPVQDAARLSMAGRLKGAAAKAINARILKSSEWKAYYAGLSDADKAKIKQVGVVVWLSSLGADDQQ